MKYSVQDIDELRRAVENRLTYGTSYFPPQDGCRIGRTPSPSAIEESVRTYMLAGLKAKDLLIADEKAYNMYLVKGAIMEMERRDHYESTGMAEHP